MLEQCLFLGFCLLGAKVPISMDVCSNKGVLRSSVQLRNWCIAGRFEYGGLPCVVLTVLLLCGKNSAVFVFLHCGFFLF